MYSGITRWYKPILNVFRKKATPQTKRKNIEAYNNIDWKRLDIEKKLAKEHCIMATPSLVIKRQDSFLPIWDLKMYEFLLEENIPDTVHPKLWEQGKLNLNGGLFRVTDKIYQIRGFDLANMTLIRGQSGWIIIGCLSSMETAEAAIQLAKQYEDIPISAVIITHSHADHYGGVLGVIKSGTVDDIKVYAPKGFTKAVIEENVYAGIAMARRGMFMYGELLLRDKKGQVDNGIGKYVSGGTQSLVKNINEIKEDPHKGYHEKVIDGVTMQFQLTPNTEAKAEMNIFIPSEKALCIAENCTATLHNLYTLRGAEVRDPVAWAKYIQQAIDLFGDDLTTVFEVHNWPRRGNKYCIDYMEKQRDMYQYMNDQTLRLINQGYTIDEVGRMIKFPESISKEWYNSPFYGTVNHNVKAVYQKYMGWYNGNPVDLNKLLPQDSAEKYVEYMGGEENILEKAKKSFEQGEYQWVAEVTKHIIYANPGNRDARLLCADALEQLGYIAESGPWRNEYLVGAFELRFGNTPMPGTTLTDEVLNALPLDKVLYFFSIRIDGLKAGNFNYRMNFIIPDRKEEAVVEIKRGILRYLSDQIDPDASVTIIMAKDTLYQLATTNKPPTNASIAIEGDKRKWELFLWSQDIVDKDFNIVTPLPKKN
ncbi:alkyl/aryl-sulfatase [Vallitalea okinawensis]|uniref:alkyl/aryl-sulfatase n=1 Tax=Vallitalea okinawensis TaxID=2078660 RepID=UPI001A9A346B|nr:alkyl sulfatase dimerization domain-containing protein [Vallitalea okinawensis]